MVRVAEVPSVKPDSPLGVNTCEPAVEGVNVKMFVVVQLAPAGTAIPVTVKPAAFVEKPVEVQGAETPKACPVSEPAGNGMVNEPPLTAVAVVFATVIDKSVELPAATVAELSDVETVAAPEARGVVAAGVAAELPPPLPHAVNANTAPAKTSN